MGSVLIKWRKAYLHSTSETDSFPPSLLLHRIAPPSGPATLALIENLRADHFCERANPKQTNKLFVAIVKADGSFTPRTQRAPTT